MLRGMSKKMYHNRKKQTKKGGCMQQNDRVNWLMAFVLMLFSQIVSAESILGELVDAQDDFLPPDQAFQLQVTLTSPDTFQANFKIVPGHYLYKDRIQIKVDDAEITQLDLPQGEMKNDPNFGAQEVYHHDTVAVATFKPNESGQKTVTIRTKYQGCSEKGLCYAPISKTVTLPLVSILEANENGQLNIAEDSAMVGATAVQSSQQSTALLASGKLWWIVVGFFGAGLLLSLTPCVLPMIPILSSIIVGEQQASQSTRSPFGLSVSYVMGMALSYTLAGVAAGLSGNLISQSLQNPWVLGITSLVFVLLAFSMFGLYELKLPSRLESRMVSTSQRFKGGRYLGVFLMGAVSALIVSPCVAAPLAGALIYIGQTHNVVLGGVSLFALAMGMGVPLLLIGASAGKLIPKAGDWMNIVKHAFGMVMLSMAVWIVSPMLDASLVLVLSAVLATFSAVYAWYLARQSTRHFARRLVSDVLAFLLGIFAAVTLIGALSGGQSVMQPLSHLQLSSALSKIKLPTLPFQRVSTVGDLSQKLQQAKGKAVMLDFYADWCVACKEMEHETFSQPEIQALLKNTLLLQADVTKNSAADKALLKQFGLYGPPGILFFNPEGELMRDLSTIGFKKPKAFANVLAKRDQCIMQHQKC